MEAAINGVELINILDKSNKLATFIKDHTWVY